MVCNLLSTSDQDPPKTNRSVTFHRVDLPRFIASRSRAAHGPLPSHRTIEPSSASAELETASRRHRLRPVTAGQHPRTIAEHDEAAGIFLDLRFEERPRDAELVVSIEHLLDAGAFGP